MPRDERQEFWEDERLLDGRCPKCGAFWQWYDEDGWTFGCGECTYQLGVDNRETFPFIPIGAEGSHDRFEDYEVYT